MKKLKFCYVAIGLLLAGALFTQCCEEEKVATIAVTGVSLAPESLSLVVGGVTGKLTATVTPANATDKSVTWTSSDEAVATVVNGVVTPKTPGTATITVISADSHLAAAAQITVTASTVAVTGVLLTPDMLSLVVGGATGKLTATITPANATDKSVTWTSSDEAVATVVNGVVTPKTPGTATITAISADGNHVATAQITVTASAVAVTGVLLTPDMLSLVVGGATGKLTATVAPTDATDKTVTWTSSDEAVATVVNGVVTPKTPGTATITAISADSHLAATAQITVTASTVAVTDVLLTPDMLSLVVGGATGKLTATVAPTDATDKTVTWTSSDEAVATVVNGVVIPKTAGTTTITVTSADGNHVATAQITVMTRFVSVWATTDADNYIILPLVSTGTYNFTVDWGDGTADTISSWNDPKKIHTYTTAGGHTVTIAGDIWGWSFSEDSIVSPIVSYKNPNAYKLKEIKSWGSLALGDTFGQFAGATNLVISATDAPDLTHTTSLRYCFLNDSSFNSPINHWNTGTITNMGGMFQYAVSFNQALNRWNTGKVINMGLMFDNAKEFNQDIGSWNTESVTTTLGMFSNTRKFNQDISSWNVGNVIDMRGMFSFAEAFSQDLSGWNVRKVTYHAGFSDRSGLNIDQLPKFSED